MSDLQSKPRPKFCVGEEVALVSKNNPQKNSERTEITNRIFGNGVVRATGERIENGHFYQLSHTADSYWGEQSLRKLPPEDRTSWEDCAFNPLKVKA